MAPRFDTFQRNMLLTGGNLYAVLPAAQADHRVVLTLWGYEETPEHPGGRSPSIFLNGDHSNERFVLDVVEVRLADVEAGYDTPGTDLFFRNDIASIDELERLVASYLDDFTRLTSSCRIT
jgi:hypothetical protein